MTASVRLAVAGLPALVALAVGVAVTVALDGLYGRLGYHDHYPDAVRRTRLRMAGFGLVCGLAGALAAVADLWLPLALSLGALGVAVRRELVPPPEFVPIGELEPSAGPDADAVVVEDGLVLSALLADWHVWAPLALLAGAVETGLRAALGWSLTTAFTLPLGGDTVVYAAIALGASYPLALVLRRPWRDASFGDASWYVAVGFWAFSWGGTWLTLSLASLLLVRFGLVSPLAVLVGVLALAHLPPDEGDAPLELVLLYWPGAVAVVGLLAGVEWLLRSGVPV